MNGKKLNVLLVGGAFTLLMIFGAVTYGVANAQASTPTAPATPAAPGQLPGWGIGNGGVTDQELANALGIDLSTLQEAQKSATDAALKQAVADGLITQAQADQLSQDSANGRPFRGLPFLKSDAIDYDAFLADALGIQKDALLAARQQAYFATIDAAVTNGNMTQEQADLAKGRYALANNAAFQASMSSAYETALNQAVTEGVITQAQADALLNAGNGLPFFGPGGFGGRGGHGGRGGPGGWGPFGDAQSAPSIGANQ